MEEEFGDVAEADIVVVVETETGVSAEGNGVVVTVTKPDVDFQVDAADVIENVNRLTSHEHVITLMETKAAVNHDNILVGSDEQPVVYTDSKCAGGRGDERIGHVYSEDLQAADALQKLSSWSVCEDVHVQAIEGDTTKTFTKETQQFYGLISSHPPHDNKCYRCSSCESTFQDVQSQLTHLGSHSNLSLICDSCQYKAISKDDLLVHTQRIHCPGFKCSECKTVFTKSKLLLKHCLRQHGLHLCPMCFAPYSCESDLEKHRVELHDSTCVVLCVNNKNQLAGNNKKQMSVTNKNQMSFRDHAKNAEMVCKLCCKQFNAAVGSACTMEKDECKESGTGWLCFCSQMFESREALVIHNQAHKIWQCDVCSKNYSSKRVLDRHKLTHSGSRPHVCNVCKRSFVEKSGLQRHRNIHTGVKPFCCKKCNACFVGKHQLTRHMRKHNSKDNPYTCKTCGRQFLQRSHLVAHERTHTGEKPYACGTCGRRFAHRSDVTRHIRIHTGEKPYLCEQCGRSFNQTTLLHKHRCRKNQPTCQHCHKAFDTIKALRRHQSNEGNEPMCSLLTTQVVEVEPGTDDDVDEAVRLGEAGGLIVMQSLGHENGDMSQPVQISVVEIVDQNEIQRDEMHREEQGTSEHHHNTEMKQELHLNSEQLSNQMLSNGADLHYEHEVQSDTGEHKASEGLLRVGTKLGLDYRKEHYSDYGELTGLDRDPNPEVPLGTAMHTKAEPGSHPAPPDACVRALVGDVPTPALPSGSDEQMLAGRPPPSEELKSLSDDLHSGRNIAVLADSSPGFCEPNQLNPVVQSKRALEAHGVSYEALVQAVKLSGALESEEGTVIEVMLPGQSGTLILPCNFSTQLNRAVVSAPLRTPAPVVNLPPATQPNHRDKGSVMISRQYPLSYQSTHCTLTNMGTVTRSVQGNPSAQPSSTPEHGKTLISLLNPVIPTAALKTEPIVAEMCDESGENHDTGIAEKVSFECSNCDLTFTSDTSFKRHATEVHGFLLPRESPKHRTLFPCHLCSKTYTRSSDLSVHINRHTGALPYECHVCRKRFGGRNTLQKHLKLHEGVKPHKCDLCGAAYLRRNQLILHVSSAHTGARPEKCDVCEKGFVDKSGLARHRRSHLGLKPHGCHICSSRFAQKGTLKNHILRQHGSSYTPRTTKL